MIYVGMDIHKRFSQVAALDESGEVLDQRCLNHTPTEELIDYFNEFPKDKQVIVEPACVETKYKSYTPLKAGKKLGNKKMKRLSLP